MEDKNWGYLWKVSKGKSYAYVGAIIMAPTAVLSCCS